MRQFMILIAFRKKSLNIRHELPTFVGTFDTKKTVPKVILFDVSLTQRAIESPVPNRTLDKEVPFPIRLLLKHKISKMSKEKYKIALKNLENCADKFLKVRYLRRIIKNFPFCLVVYVYVHSLRRRENFCT